MIGAVDRQSERRHVLRRLLIQTIKLLVICPDLHDRVAPGSIPDMLSIPAAGLRSAGG